MRVFFPECVLLFTCQALVNTAQWVVSPWKREFPQWGSQHLGCYLQVQLESPAVLIKQHRT